MQTFYQKLIVFLFFMGCSLWLGAQISSGGTPQGLQTDFRARYGKQFAKATNLPKFNLQKVLAEDAQTNGMRVAAPIKVDLGLDNSGRWIDLDNGDRLWQLHLRSKDATGLAILYDQLYLPPGATLFMYQPDGSQVLGAYTFESNTPDYTFMTGFIYGESAVLEYYEPSAVRGQGRLHIFRIDHGYKKVVEAEKTLLQNTFGFGAAATCNKNVNCPEGSNWQRQKRGICRIIVVVEEGTGFCTGNLLNNAAEDQKLYILSAFHCQDGFTPQYNFWRFDFNYEASACSNPGSEPAFQSVLGSTLRASRQQNDFLLLEIQNPIPPSYNVYFNGWDRKNAPPPTSFSIHHARGDIKKISIENNAATIFPNEFSWQNAQGVIISTTPPNHLFRVKFDDSTIEAGSSGAALFDPNGRVVGQLHGGFFLGSCTVNDAFSFFDRFSLSWEGGGTPETRLKDWLDPEDTGLTFIDGIEQTGIAMARVSGFIRDANGRGVAGVNVQLVGALTMATVTDTSGAYSFENLPTGTSLGLNLEKNFNARNGIGVLDIILISKHILSIEPFESPLSLLAADVDNSGSINILDLIQIRKITLSIDLTFPSSPSWRFLPAGFTFLNPQRPWDDFIPSVFSLPAFSGNLENIDFTGIKMGDVDFSANPRE